MNKYTLFLFIALLASTSFSQKVALSDTAWDDWKSTSNVSFSEDGNLYYYVIYPQAGDATMHFKKSAFKIDSLARAKRGFYHTTKPVLFTTVNASYDSIRELKISKTKKSKWPKDTLVVVKKDTVLHHAKASNWGFQEEGEYYYYITSKNNTMHGWSKKKKKAFKKKEVTSEGKTAFVKNITTLEQIRFDNVTEIIMASTGPYAVILQQLTIDDSTTYSMKIVDLATGETKDETKSGYQYEKITFDHYGRQFGYFTSADTNEHKTYTALHVNLETLQTDTMFSEKDSLEAFKPLFITENSSFTFSKSGKKVYLSFGHKPDNIKRDTLPKDEIPVLDVWSHHDLELQPRQKLMLKAEASKTYLALLVNNRFQLIENDVWGLTRMSKDNEGVFFILRRSKPYEKSYSWTTPWLSDYKVLGEKLEKKLTLEQLGNGMDISPKGLTVCYYNHLDSSYVIEDIASGNKRLFSSHIARWYQDNNGNPFVPGNIGILGWKSESEVYVKSRKGIYLLSSEKHQKILKNEHESNFKGIRFNYDKLYLDAEDFVLIGQDLRNNKETLYQFEKGGFSLKSVRTVNEKFYGVKRGKLSGPYMVRTMTFTKYPDIHITNSLTEVGERKTFLDNQRKKYLWGTVKRVFWKSYDGTELSGLVYLPENVDTSKKLPAIVYFYELYTQREHNFYSPKPSASVINPVEYVSNGYVVFMPDIRYKPGFPAQSAYDAIMSGTDYLLENYSFVDSTKLGLQGQSWGGYQTAQMITMTKRYAAGMAGAPVSNMFSAYGGIRWGSGLSREFQYERTQSRIGGTIWDSTASYMANSPIFGLPNVTTPLLIMHNDNDGAVPWYQGIEMFMGLRRLNKPVWMLVYNGEQHNLMQRRNRKDLSIRMMQFFDVYLKQAAMPNWMLHGVKMTEKGKDFNWQYQLSE